MRTVDSSRARRIAVAAALPLAGVLATPAGAAGTLTFRSPAECVHVLKLPAATCASIMQRAWSFYQENAPRYATRRGCWLNHQVCIVLPADRVLVDERKGPVAPIVSFGPPLWAIRFREDDPGAWPDVLIDRGMVLLEINRLTPIPITGRFAPTPARIREIYMNELSADKAEPPPPRAGPAGVAARRSREPPVPAGAFSPEDTFPVAPSRLREMRRAMQR